MLIPKQESYRSTKLRQSAKDQMCLLRSTDCNFNPETTVLCHDNSLSSGKGMAYKANDFFAFFGCSCCHAKENEYKPRVPHAIKSTWLWWIAKGFLVVDDKCAFEDMITTQDWVECKNKFLNLWNQGLIHEPR